MSPPQAPSDDEEALIQTYRRTIRPLYAYVSRRVGGDVGLAEDLVQDTWMRALDTWPARGVPEEPLAWLIRVAHNALVSHFRRSRPEPIDPATIDLEAAATSTDAADTASTISWGMARLRRVHADVLEAFYFDGKSVREIAREQSTSERAVEGRLRRARAKLKKVPRRSCRRRPRVDWRRTRRQAMDSKHEPRDEFVERLEERIAAEVRRRQRVAPASPWTRWIPQRPLQAALAVLALVVVSMLIGGIVVAAAYQAQTNERRDVLLFAYQGQVRLAQERLDLAKTQLQGAQQRFSVGTGDQNALLEATFKVKEAQAQLVSMQLQLKEVEITGLEPLDQVSAPLVEGRDFVSERWRTDLSVPMAALDWEKARLADVQRRVAVGAANAADADLARSRITELEASGQAIQRKLAIRQQFLRRELDAELAVLRVLEAEAQQRAAALAPRIDLAHKQLKDMMTKVEIGTASAIELAQAQVRVKELELDLIKAEMDLTVIRQQIQQHRIDG